MAQQFTPVPTLSEASDGAEVDPKAQPSTELRIERSRFSRLLAKFGLGELTDPILRPNKHSAKQGHG